MGPTRPTPRRGAPCPDRPRSRSRRAVGCICRAKRDSPRRRGLPGPPSGQALVVRRSHVGVGSGATRARAPACSTEGERDTGLRNAPAPLVPFRLRLRACVGSSRVREGSPRHDCLRDFRSLRPRRVTRCFAPVRSRSVGDVPLESARFHRLECRCAAMRPGRSGGRSETSASLHRGPRPSSCSVLPPRSEATQFFAAPSVRPTYFAARSCFASPSTSP